MFLKSCQNLLVRGTLLCLLEIAPGGAVAALDNERLVSEVSRHEDLKVCAGLRGWQVWQGGNLSKSKPTSNQQSKKNAWKQYHVKSILDDRQISQHSRLQYVHVCSSSLSRTLQDAMILTFSSFCQITTHSKALTSCPIWN